MDIITLDNLRTRSTRLTSMYPHQAADDVNQLEAFDAGQLRHVASFLRESRDDNEWWRVHAFVCNGEAIYITRDCDGEIYRSDAWGSAI